ncbi:hypothetical protein Tco_0925950 [Tanacetum coccineum]|uniref:Uncharacterized protein n=1 Tax=Tanacetum coccineum TaxID=301880 RepID=A0ABQ5D8D0_9ASTR
MSTKLSSITTRLKEKTVNWGSPVTSHSRWKKITVTEASVRGDLQLDDEEGIDCLPNATIFEELTRISSKTTAWNEFSSTMASAIIYEAVNEEMDDSLERAATTATSLDAEQDRGNINKNQSKATPNEPSSLGTSSGSGLKRQETMGDTIA